MATNDIDHLEWLATWYGQQCDGRWEHQRGLWLDPLSLNRDQGQGPGNSQGARPGGWRLRIDLCGTAAAGLPPRRLAVCTVDGRWLRCTLNGQRFAGEGAEVEELIGVFRRWIEAQTPVPATVPVALATVPAG